MESLQLKNILETAGITQIIWIDDRFDPVPAGAIAEGLLAELVTRVKVSGRTLQYDKITFTPDSEVDELLKDIRDSDDPNAFSAVYKLAREELRKAGEVPDYSDEDLTAVTQSLGSVRAIGFDEWATQSESVLSSLTGETLVIIDNEPGHAGSPVNGKQLFTQLTSRHRDCFILMLTHSVTDETSADTMRQSLDPDGTLRHRFSVMSKSRGAQPLVSHLGSKVRAVVTRRSGSVFAKSIADVLRESAKEVEDFLSKISLATFDHVVFQNSIEEGASEIDVLLRLFHLNQRIQVEQAILANGRLASYLDSIRRLRSLAPELPPDEDLKAIVEAEKGKLYQWREREVYDTEETINRGHRPLRCGDIFELTNADGRPTKLYILLGQPCEMAVRANGRRGMDEAIFVRLILESATNGEPERDSPSQRYRLPRFKDNDAYLKLTEWCTVNLRCLDFAVFNSNGKVELFADTVEPHFLLPGWLKRIQEAKTAMSKRTTESAAHGKGKGKSPDVDIPAGYRSLSYRSDFSGGVMLSAPMESGRVGVVSSWQRIASLRSPWSTAGYTAFFSWRTRTAFDHDFMGKG